MEHENIFSNTFLNVELDIVFSIFFFHGPLDPLGLDVYIRVFKLDKDGIWFFMDDMTEKFCLGLVIARDAIGKI
jgi:hypothetical protein